MSEEHERLLAVALRHAEFALHDLTEQVPFLDEADRIFERLVRLDSAAAQVVVEAASVKRALAKALLPVFSNDDRMRSVRAQALTFAESIGSSDLAHERDLEDLARVLIDVGFEGLGQRRTAKEHWHSDVERAVAALDRSLDIVGSPSVSSGLRRATGRRISAAFPNILDKTTDDLKFAALNPLVRLVLARELVSGADLQVVADQRNQLIDVWARAADFADDLGPAQLGYTQTHNAEGIRQEAVKIVARSRSDEFGGGLPPKQRSQIRRRAASRFVRRAVIGGAAVHWPGRWLVAWVLG